MTKHECIADALSAAQAEMGVAAKDAVNPHFKSKYADLASVRAVATVLNTHGIAYIQPVVQLGEGWGVQTILLWKGERLHGDAIPLLLGKHDMQGFKSAVTYARRIGLGCMGGIADGEDDDGNAAADNAPKGKAPMPRADILGDLLAQLEATPPEQVHAWREGVKAGPWAQLTKADQKVLAEAAKAREAKVKPRQAADAGRFIPEMVEKLKCCTDSGEVEAVIADYSEQLLRISVEQPETYDQLQATIDEHRERVA